MSPVVFLIWMAPILEKMEKNIKPEAGRVRGGVRMARMQNQAEFDVELPSVVDEVEVNVKRIVREVAEECSLPLKTDKEEILHLRKNRKGKNADRKYVKWLDVIFDGSLDFDIHWKSRLTKARKALGALSGGGRKHTKG